MNETRAYNSVYLHIEAASTLQIDIDPKHSAKAM